MVVNRIPIIPITKPVSQPVLEILWCGIALSYLCFRVYAQECDLVRMLDELLINFFYRIFQNKLA